MGLVNTLKRFKFTHWIYNLLHYKKLAHNRQGYKIYHINKPLFSSISSKDFPDKTSRAWLDTGHSKDLVPFKAGFTGFDANIQQQLVSWSDNGYLVLEHFFNG